MKRTLELYSDGRLYEMEDDLARKVTETKGNVDRLIEALKFSVAREYSISPPSKEHPEVVEARGVRNINEKGLRLLTTFENCKLTAYDDGGGVWTCGVGHTAGVKEGMTITQAQADDWLRNDITRFESYVEQAVEIQINNDQFSALVCFCFNVGPGTKGFGGSTLLQKLNAGDFLGASEQFLRWNKVEGESWLGLTRRRLAEQALFLSKPWEFARTYDGPADVQSASTTAQVAGARTLKFTDPRMEGEDVRLLQLALQKHGLTLVADGIFGKGTEEEVRKFQKQKGLEVDGVAGSATFSALT